MFSDKANINILTAVLRDHGVTTAVVCPGARNAPIVQNLHEAGFKCHAVTDERSAGFYALGMALVTGTPVVVCVTSGTALLNLAPAVAEAWHRHCPLVVISADRPAERIGQLDAQTMPQQGALSHFVAISVSLPEAIDKVSRIHCNRLVNEALIAATSRPNRPVHINVPVAEPLFNFTTAHLPAERIISRMNMDRCVNTHACQAVVERLQVAKRPMIVVGQLPQSKVVDDFIDKAKSLVTTLYEPLSCSHGGVLFDEALAMGALNNDYAPDFVLYIGGIIVSKRLKIFLQNAPGAETWLLSRDGEVHDTFMNLTTVIDAPIEPTLAEIALHIHPNSESMHYKLLWDKLLEQTLQRIYNQPIEYNEEGVVRLFEQMLDEAGIDCTVHYANSTAVRLGCRYAKHYIEVNRGVNGIEGSLSTAAGFSLCNDKPTFCVIGDLSFFYDINALWNNKIDGRLRILLLNNGGGAIFGTLPGLETSDATRRFVVGEHNATANGLCTVHNVDCARVEHERYLKEMLDAFINASPSATTVLEIHLNN